MWNFARTLASFGVLVGNFVYAWTDNYWALFVLLYVVHWFITQLELAATARPPCA